MIDWSDLKFPPINLPVIGAYYRKDEMKDKLLILEVE
jgi:hypothetical protein